MKVTGRLEQWVRQSVPGGYVIWGLLYDDIHQRWTPGSWVHTSLITTEPQPLKSKPPKTVVVTRNSVYVLGTPASAATLKFYGFDKGG